MKKKLELSYRKAHRVLRNTFNNALEHELPLHGAAIAFYTIFSIAPLMIIILYLSELLLSDQIARLIFFAYLSDLIGPDSSESLRNLASSYSGTGIGSGIITNTLAIGMILFGATTAISQLKSSINMIWGVEAPKRNFVYRYIVDRFFSFLLILIVTGLFVASLFFDALIPFLLTLFSQVIPDSLASLLLYGIPVSTFLAALFFFGLLFRFLPDVSIAWKKIFAGALFTTLLFFAGKGLIEFYLQNSYIRAAYKAAGSFVIFFLWIYYNVQIVLFGAEFTYAYATDQENEEEKS